MYVKYSMGIEYYVDDLNVYLPEGVNRTDNLDKLIPSLAKSKPDMCKIEAALKRIPTNHKLLLADSTAIDPAELESVHLVVTSPPYWVLKRYREHEGQLGHIKDYNRFLASLDLVWERVYNALVPGGRLVCVVGDVCLSRRRNNGVHTCVPLHSSIQEHCKKLGFANLAPIIWHKITNATYEVKGNSRFLGKPYEPNGVIKNDIEYILMLRKPGGYRKPTKSARLLSIISDNNHKVWFQQIWHDINGESTRQHPAPFPLSLSARLIRMFSFAGDTVLDPFMGTGTTNLAAAQWGRNSIGIELDPIYFNHAKKRLQDASHDFFTELKIIADFS